MTQATSRAQTPTFKAYLSGPADAPVLVFLHGFMGSAADFGPICASLDGRYRCVRVDLPGHGEAPLPDRALSMPALADALVDELLEGDVSRDSARPTLVGYSMGGRLALQTALDHPDAVGKVVLVSTSPGIADEQARAERRRKDAERAAEIRDHYDAFLERWYRLPIFGDLADSPAYSDMLARRRQNDPAAMARVIVDLSPGRQPSNWDRLDQLAHTTWVVGAHDPKYLALGRSLETDGHQVIVVPNAAHALHVETPEAFVRSTLLDQPS